MMLIVCPEALDAGELHADLAQTARAPASRLPYLLAKLKAPRVLERLEQTAQRARAEQWPYEQFLEALLEAEVFARDASGARQRIRHAGFPARKTLEDFDWQAQPAPSGRSSPTSPISGGSRSTQPESTVPPSPAAGPAEGRGRQSVSVRVARRRRAR